VFNSAHEAPTDLDRIRRLKVAWLCQSVMQLHHTCHKLLDGVEKKEWLAGEAIHKRCQHDGASVASDRKLLPYAGEAAKSYHSFGD
jgi:hypothetical protein